MDVVNTCGVDGRHDIHLQHRRLQAAIYDVGFLASLDAMRYAIDLGEAWQERIRGMSFEPIGKSDANKQQDKPLVVDTTRVDLRGNIAVDLEGSMRLYPEGFELCKRCKKHFNHSNYCRCDRMRKKKNPFRRRTLTEEQQFALEDEIKLMLHASRDCLRNQGVDTTKVTFSVQDAYYGEAFGIVRGLVAVGYGVFDADNIPGPNGQRNLKHWFSTLCDEVLHEEGYHDGTHHCEYCMIS